MMEELLTKDIELNLESKQLGLVVASELGILSVVNTLLKDPRLDPSWNQNKALEIANSNGQCDIVKRLLQDKRVDPSFDDNKLFINACKRDYLDIVNLLLEDNRVDPTAQKDLPLQSAACGGHIEIVKRLLQHPKVNPNEGCHTFGNRDFDEKDIGVPLTLAIQNKDLDLVNLLLENEKVDPTVHNNEAIRMASERENVKILKRLLQDPRVDPSDFKNDAIKIASQYGNPEAVNIILQDPRVDPSDSDNKALCLAVRSLKVVNRLLQDARVCVTVEVIEAACKYGTVDVLDRLLEVSKFEPKDYPNGIVKAIECYRFELVKRLLQEKGIQPNIENKKALVAAIKTKNDDMIHMICEYMNIPNDTHSIEEALKFTTKRQ
eukprot:TRINITY_DN2121_c0_g5_i1.p1 TRINITY_DN2121_c0_g5~~TRINITY_DN2121_c0_g5_i1.p1  ORF type:complete len:393 (-),score=78.12 TRINITY_DN2121_c0_g5_i1:34-1167(-)